LCAKFLILTVLGAVFPHFYSDKREIWHGEQTTGAMCRPLWGEKKKHFWTTE